MTQKPLRCWNQTLMRIVYLLLIMAGMLCVRIDFGTGTNHVASDVPATNPARPSARIGGSRTESWSLCLGQAARNSGVHPALFDAIVRVESGRHPYAFGWYDETRTWRSYKARNYSDAVAHLQTLERQRIRFDMGLAQVNSRNIRVLRTRTGLSSIQALDPCANLHLASVILREQIKIHGRTWKAVGGYNGAPTYAAKVYRAYCAHVPEALHCHVRIPLSHLLTYPLPLAQTGVAGSEGVKQFIKSSQYSDHTTA